MDIDTLKSAFPLLGGALALAGGVFTFVAGRLKDAETFEAKANVVRLTLEWLSLALNLAGMLTAALTRTYVVPGVLFAAAYMIQTVIFLRRTGPPSRMEMVTFSLMTSIFISAAVVALLFATMHDMLDLIRTLTELQRHQQKEIN